MLITSSLSPPPPPPPDQALLVRQWSHVFCRQYWVVSGKQTAPSFLALNPQQLRRRSVYSNAQASVQPARSQAKRPATALSEIQAWVERELQAITLDADVNIVTQVVLRAIGRLDKLVSSQGTR